MGFFDFFKPRTPRRVDTSSAAGVAEASRRGTILSDLQMGLGLIPEDSSYRARTERTKLRMRQQEIERQKRRRDDNDKPAKPAAPQKTQAEIKKETEIAEGQARRKKFEQEAAERRRKFKARTGPRLLFSSLSLNS
jgi:hypothetical protein